MSRKREAETSIIEEIVIYDKPNKPTVPKEIFPKTGNSKAQRGDIVVSLGKGESTPGSSSQKSKKVKTEPSEIDKLLGYDSEEDGEVHIKTEAEDSNEAICEVIDDSSSELEESIENISKEILNSASSKKTLKRVSNKKDETSVGTSTEKDNNTGKRPRGRPKKSEPSPQKTTLLNFVIKQPSNLITIDNNTNKTSKAHKKVNEEAPSTTNDARASGRLKRTRRRPKKFDDDDVVVDKTGLSQYNIDYFLSSDEEYAEFVPPNKRGKGQREQSDDGEFDELLNDTEQQVDTLNEVEAEIQSLVEGKKPSKKPTVKKAAKKSPVKKTNKKGEQKKITDMLEKKIKKEPTPEEEDEDESLLDVSNVEEEIVSDDDDPRREWVPPEYADYRQQHVLKLISKMHKCKFCGSEFASYYALRKHRALEHDDVGKDRKESTFNVEDENEDNPPEEILDSDDDSDAESRGEWMPQDYAEYKIKHNMSKTKRVQWYKCKICCAVFSNYYKLSKHRVEQHENKSEPYECKECDAKFKDVDELAAHIRVHQGKDPYNCRKCEKAFKRKDELISHQKVHILKKPPPKEKRYRCDVCSKEFSKLCDIERHTRVHTGEKPSECNICHKRFQQPHNLSKHLLTHLHVKPFQCEICNKKFGRIDVLNRHLLTHSVEKPYKCYFCPKSFIRQTQLTGHLERVHPDVDFNAIGLNNVTDEVTVTPVDV